MGDHAEKSDKPCSDTCGGMPGFIFFHRREDGSLVVKWRKTGMSAAAAEAREKIHKCQSFFNGVE
ncbi:MAG: hypothetical protein WCI20_15245, partial [bacterium]